MQSEPLGEQDLQEENMQIETREELIICPKCHKEGPDSMYCLNCGYPLYQEKAGESEPKKTDDVGAGVASETVGAEQLSEIVTETEEHRASKEDADEIETEKPENIESPEVMEAQDELVEEPFTKRVVKLASTSEPDSIALAREVMENLIKNISLKLWLVNLLQQGKVREEQFNRLFDGYSNRFKLSMNRRKEMLKRARDLEPIVKALNEASVNLSELEMKKTIGDISDEEYQVKAPAFKWDISKHEKEISVRKREIEFLVDLTLTTSTEKISRMKEMTENCYGVMESLEKSCDISSETATKVKMSLEEILTCLEGFGDVPGGGGTQTKQGNSTKVEIEKSEEKA